MKLKYSWLSQLLLKHINNSILVGCTLSLRLFDIISVNTMNGMTKIPIVLVKFKKNLHKIYNIFCSFSPSGIDQMWTYQKSTVELHYKLLEIVTTKIPIAEMEVIITRYHSSQCRWLNQNYQK